MHSTTVNIAMGRVELPPTSKKEYDEALLERREVRAYKTRTPGLVITRGLNDLYWVITHEGSGMALPWQRIPTLKEAMVVADALGEILQNWTGDWKAIRDTITTTVPNPGLRLSRELPLEWLSDRQRALLGT